MTSVRVISCVNQKGGVGKTTCCANIAHLLSKKGLRVWVIDMDPQGHLSQHLGDTKRRSVGLYDVLQNSSSLQQVSVPISDKLTLVPPGDKLVKLESVQMKSGRGLMLRRLIAGLADVDVVMLDCPPSNGFLVVNAIAASSELLVPVTPDFFGLSGLSEMTRQIKRYEKVMGQFDRLWVVISRHQKRKVSEEAVMKIRHYFGDQVLEQMISERAVVAESPGHGQPISDYAPQSVSQREFSAIADAILMGAKA